MRDRRRPILADVANRAGTSTAVVSYVVNGGPRPVAPETKARVERAIAELGYRRDPVAGALSVGRSNLVGLLVPDSANAFFSELASHIERAARARDLLMMLGNTGYDPSVERDYEMAFSDLRAAGTLVASIAPQVHEVVGSNRVYVHSAPRGGKGPSILFDDRAGAVAVVEHLQSHGYESVHCVTGPDDFGPAGRRVRGWRSALRRAGRSTRGLLHRAAFDRVAAQPALRELLRTQRPRAVFATTDEQALATLQAAGGLGLRVPQDLAVAGFDGVREALSGLVRVTTAAVPLSDLAAHALDILVATPGSGEVVQEILPTKLVVGETCGC